MLMAREFSGFLRPLSRSAYSLGSPIPLKLELLKLGKLGSLWGVMFHE